jgi:hypothetical protein
MGELLQTGSNESVNLPVELDSRSFDGIEATLYWNQGTKETWVLVIDSKSGEQFIVDTPERVNPMEVFYHPYAYRKENE